MRAPDYPLASLTRPTTRRFVRGLPQLLLCTALCLPFFTVHAAKVTARTGEITLPTYGWAAVKHPYFRGTDGRNIYPYPMLDFLSRDKTNRTYRTVVLENEYLRLTFLPELGGKIHEVLDKTTGQPMFYVNHVVKPGLIGQCGAWTSGGVEWNTGPQGHTVGCMQPVDVLILPPEKDGSRSVAIGETERIYRTKWTVVVTLRPGRSFIEERIRIYNPTETVRPYYFWNCTAVPNTPGFRFIYPMTLGCDHAGEKFFNWPIDIGKDLTRGTNYQDASSIFAWHCDQDFFGSYNDDLGRGVVAYANHHQLPGKKAWTWGQGGFGKMHQMDLTDDDGPYNEVQTGPLLTQAQVGRLDPCEAVEWKEWWYPVHGIGGFTFANKDVAVNVERDGTNVFLRVIGTAVRHGVDVKLAYASNLRDVVAKAGSNISPTQPTILNFCLPSFVANDRALLVEFRHQDDRIALFRFPLDLPTRQPPETKRSPETAGDFAERGWQSFLFAQFSEAEGQFRKALEKDPKSASALTGLAFLRLEADPRAAATNAPAAMAVEPGSGLAHYALALAEDRSATVDNGAERRKAALSEAWESSLDPASAAAGRALIAKLHMRYFGYRETVNALSGPGPWQADPMCRNRLALAFFELGEKAEAVRLARENLQVDPLDYFARSILWRANAETDGLSFVRLLKVKPHAVLDLAEEYWDLLQDHWVPVLQLLGEFFTDPATGKRPRRNYNWQEVTKFVASLRLQLARESLPYKLETVSILENALEMRFDDNDGKANLYLGHLLFHLGRHAEGREMWKRAAELGAEPVIAYRALGMAAKTLDNDLKSAREWLEKANQADPKDSIVARDLANVLFALADKADSDAEKRALASEARDRLRAAFEEGKGRSDFVALLARAQNRLDEYAETARMLDSVRVTIWEGAHEVHDLFVQSHLAMGEAHLKAGRAAEALAEFNRALEYPVNLATGKLENAREAHIHYARGNALAALGRKQDAAAAWKLAADEPASSDSVKEDARAKAQAALKQAHDSP